MPRTSGGTDNGYCGKTYKRTPKPARAKREWRSGGRSSRNLISPSHRSKGSRVHSCAEPLSSILAPNPLKLVAKIMAPLRSCAGNALANQKECKMKERGLRAPRQQLRDRLMQLCDYYHKWREMLLRKAGTGCLITCSHRDSSII